jgi:hypothetical protein
MLNKITLLSPTGTLSIEGISFGLSLPLPPGKLGIGDISFGLTFLSPALRASRF